MTVKRKTLNVYTDWQTVIRYAQPLEQKEKAARIMAQMVGETGLKNAIFEELKKYKEEH